ncbi:T9SS type A sorting domain-containing protein [Bacteroidota bacterium]
MRITITILLLLFSFNSLQAQKEANNWVFSFGNGLTFNLSDTCSNPPCIFNTPYFGFREGYSAISDSSGKLLMYSNGNNIFLPNHDTIVNGTGLYGHWSSTQSSLIIKQLGSKDTFLIFTVDGVGLTERCKSKGFNYSRLVINDENPKGILFEKNIHVLDDCTEKLAAVKNRTCNSYWVIIHEWESNAFRAYLINNNGISEPVISTIGSVHGNNDSCDECFNKAGFMKISPSGNKIAVAVTCDAFVEIFDFDNKTGILSNDIIIKEDFFKHIYALEFSPNENFLYIYNGKLDNSDCDKVGLYQYDILKKSKEEIISSRTKINDICCGGAGLQLGPDGKLYIEYYMKYFIDVIENPNKKYPDCNYKSNAIKTKYETMIFPNFVSSYFAENIVSLPDTVVKIGSDISIPINININCVCGENDPGFTYSAEIQFDASFFFPYDTPVITGNTIIDGKRILTLEGEFKPESQETVIAEIPGLVLLGDSMKTPLEINKFEILNSDINIETQDGSLEIYGICQPEISRIKLIQPLQVNLSPNPADMELTLNIKSRETGEHNIFVYNARGIELAHISWQGGSASKDINIDVSGYPSGLYFVKIQTGMYSEVVKALVVH